MFAQPGNGMIGKIFIQSITVLGGFRRFDRSGILKKLRVILVRFTVSPP